MFWRNVLKCYKTYCTSFEKNNTEPHYNRPIFFNPVLNISSTLTGCKKLQNAGIFFVKQIFNSEENRMLTKDEMTIKYDIRLDFISMKHIENGLKKYRNCAKNNNEIEYTSQITDYCYNILKSEKGTRNIYPYLLPESNKQKIFDRWKKEGVENVNWKEIYKVIDKSLDCTKLKWMQIRIVNHILTTNKSVSKFKLNQSPLCTFCNMTDETIAHIFYDCSKVKEFWRKLEQQVYHKCPNIRIQNIPRQMILLGTSPEFHSTSIFDIILVMAKLYIYRQKVKNETLNIEIFIQELKTRYEADKYNATIQNSNKLELRWHDFKPLVAN